MSEPVDDRDVVIDASDLLRVVRGEPDEMELAALVAGIMAAAGSIASSEPEAASPAPWSDHARRLGVPPRPGPDGWRWSLRQ